MVARGRLHGVVVAVTSWMCQRTANLSTTCPAAGSCSLLLLLAPFPGPNLFSPILQLVPWCLSLSPCCRCPSFSSLPIPLLALAASTWSPASYPGSLPPFPSPLLSIHLTSLLEKSVFLIYCKTKGRKPKSHLLMIAAVLLTFSRAKGVLRCFTSPKGEPCFCHWTDANLLQQRICLVGLGFSVAGLLGVGGRADPWLQMNAEIARHSYVHPPRPLHLLSASFIAVACALTETRHV